MALSDEDLKKMGGVVDSRVVEALEQVVFPELMKIEKRLEKMATKDDLANLEKRMDEKMEGMEGMEGRLTKRIDRVAEIVTDTRTNHERRIRKLEEEVGIEPGVKLVV